MKTRVLVVDDDRLVADTLSLIFNANGYECEARYTAQDAFERARVFSPALLLSDISMPEQSGLELARRMQQEMPETRLLLLTAYSSNAAEVARHSQHMHRPLTLLRKPCRPDDLLRQSRALLAS